VLSAGELHERAVRATNAGRHGVARRLLLTAADRGPGTEVRARIALSLAYLDAERSRVADGLERCAEALALAGISDGTRGLAQSQRGLLLMRAGDVAGALAAFGTAEPLLRAAGAWEPLARLHLNRGNVHLQGGDVDAARDDFERCIGLVAGTAPLMAARARHNLGYAHLLRGDLVAALRHMDEARPVLEPVSAVSRAVGAQDRAEVLLAAGLLDEAVDALRLAAAAFGGRGLRQQQGEAELVLARALARSDRLGEARTVARRAARRFTLRGATTWALRAQAVALSVGDPHDRRTAEELARVAAELSAAGLPGEAATAQEAAARVLVRCGELAAAHGAATRPLSRTAAPVQRIGRRLLRAELAAASGQAGAARRHLRLGLDELNAWQSTFGSLDVQTALSGHGRALAEQGLRSALADGRPAVVLEWAERARALASRVTTVRPPADPQLARDLATLRTATGDAEARLRERVRARAWQGHGAGHLTRPATMGEVRAALAGRDGTLVAHIVLDGRLAALVVTAGSARVHHLGPVAAVRRHLDGLQADLDVAAAATVPAPLRQVVLGSLGRRLSALSSLLWGGLPDVGAGASAVVLVPSGSLAAVPWACLPDLAGRPLTVARSAASWLRERPKAPRQVGLVAGPRVARAQEEVARSAAVWVDARTLVGADASAAAVSALAADVDLLHVAAHGRHSADSPLFSALELVDGPWHGYDVDQLPRVPSLVVLSACELGRSAVRWGAETIGATVAWQHAGAVCVVASPTRVADDLACEVLAATHAGLASGQTPADALAAARAAVDPYAVVPFTCFGAGW
jgi:tetratricopeptide (TPR) repeat protein